MQNKAKNRLILLVEGHRTGGVSALADALRKASFDIRAVTTGREALDWLQTEAPDLVIIDSSSMRSSGARTCRRIRGILGERPIIHCRDQGEDEDRTMLADIYLEQPFTGRKILNRVRDLLPIDFTQEEVVRFGHLLFYPSKHAVEIPEKGEQHLTPKLSQLLVEFLLHPNELVTRRQLMQNVWNTDYVGDTRTLDVHMRWVRECIEEDPSNPRLLRTIRGKGFVFSIPDHYRR